MPWVVRGVVLSVSAEQSPSLVVDLSTRSLAHDPVVHARRHVPASSVPVTASSLPAVADLFASLGRDIASSRGVDDAMQRLTSVTLQAVAPAEAAAVSRGRHDRAGNRFETVAATSDLPHQVDEIQYQLGHGPCVDAILDNAVFRARDLRTDTRWPEFGRRAAEETGVLSMLSYRLFLEDDDLLAGLNLYSTEPDAFDEHAEAVGTLIATHGALEVSNARHREKIDNLNKALASNRDIGVAMGVLMTQHKITREQAFNLLRVASQHRHRKLADIAGDVADTGTLDLPGTFRDRS